MADLRSARGWWDVLRYTAFTGTDHAPERSAGLRRLRGFAIVGCGLWAGLVTRLTVSTLPVATLFNVAVTVLPCLLAVRSSLWGWRALVVGLVLTPLTLTGMTESWGWPWSPGLALTAALICFLVGANNEQAVLACAALISIGAAVPFLRDWRDTALLVLLGGILFFVGNTLRQRRLAEQARATQQERRIAEEMRAAMLEARTGIARELHDVVAHHMSVLALRADSARFRFADLDDEVRREFADLAGTAREGLTELRRLLGVLRSDDRDPQLVPQPGLAKVVELVDRVRTAGTPCELDLRGEIESVPTGVALSVCRIAQEALSNAIRHAPGSSISVELVTAPRSLRLVVDNGPGDRPPRLEQEGTGHGLLGMRERAAMLAADLEAQAKPDGGFRVTLTVPLDREGYREP